MSEVFDTLGIRPILNAVGNATRVSGSCPPPEVVAAMAAASSEYFEIDEETYPCNGRLAKISQYLNLI